MSQQPDFYLSTAGEYGPLSDPRACWCKARMRDEQRDDYMMIEIEPLLEGQQLGLGSRSISSLVVSSRHSEQTLFPISEWPSFVYVARILDDSIASSLQFTRGQVELIAWGSLFRTLEQARDFASRFEQ